MAAVGAQKYQDLLDAGAPQQDAEAWKERRKEEMRAAGAPQDAIDKYWGDTDPDMTPINNLAVLDQSRRTTDGTPQNLVQDFEAGWQHSAVGLSLGKPVLDPRNSSLASMIASGIGQMGGDLPLMVGGAIAGAPGGPITQGAASFAAPEAYRQIMMDYYTHRDDVRPPTFNEAWSRITQGTWETAKAGITGGISVPIGGKVGGKVLEMTGSKLLGSSSDVLAMTAAATGTGSALEGHWPEPNDWIAGSVLALGFHGAVTAVGATGRLKSTPAGEVLTSNMRNIYARTGVPPWKQGSMAAADPEFRQETFSHDVNQEPVLTKFTEMSPPEAGAKMAAAARGAKEEGKADAAKMLMSDAKKVRLDLVRHLEQSGDSAVSPAGAIGRYQIMPGTAKQYGFDPAKLKDPLYNENVASYILDQLDKRYANIQDPKAKLEAILIAYNAGPGRADAWLAHGRDDKRLPVETQKYLNHAQRLGALTEEALGGGGGKEPPKGPGDLQAGGEPPGKGPDGKPIELTPEMIELKTLDLIAKPEPESFLDRGKDLASTAYDRYISELGPAKRFDKVLAAEGKLPEGGFGVEDAFRSTYASAEYAGHFLRHGVIDAISREKTSNESYIGSYKLAKSSGGTEEGFTAYRLAKRQIEKAGQGIDVGGRISLDEATRLVEAGKGKYAEADAMINRVKNGMLDYARDSGLYSAEQVSAIKRNNKSHIPHKRAMGEGQETVLGPGRRFRARQPLQKMVGSQRQIVEPVYADIENGHTLIALSDRNRAAGSIVGSADARRLFGLEKIENAHKIEVFGPDGKKIDGLDDQGRPLSDLDVQAQVFRSVEKSLGPNQFPFYNNGKLEIWNSLDPDLAAMIRGATKADEGLIFGVAKWFTSLKRAGIIDMPDYIAKMIIKDQFTTPIVDKFGGVPFQNFLIGVHTALNNKEKWLEFVRNGGMGAALAAMDARYIRRDVESVFKQTDVWSKTINTVRDLKQAMQLLMERMDAMSRLGRYVRRTKTGKVSNFKAGMESRKVYIDFQERMASSHLNDLAKIDAFLRPTILSFDQFGHAVKTDPAGVALRGMAYIGIPAAVFFALNWLHDKDKDVDDPTRYNNLDRWTRDNYFVLPDYFGEHIKFPRSQGPYGLVFGGLTDRFLEWHSNEDPGSFEKYAKELVGTFVPNVLPDVTYPLAEQLSGESLFMGRPLISSQLAEASGPMQYTPNTTEIAKKLAEVMPPVQILGVGLPLNSPIVLENYVRGWGGTGGINLLRALNMPLSKNNSPVQLADIPFVSSFFIRHESMNLEPMEQFYDAYKNVKQANKDKFLALERGQQSGDFTEFEKVGENMEAFLNIQSVATALNTMQTAIQGISQDAEMAPAEKRQFIDDILRTAITTARTGREIIGAVNATEAP